MSKKALLLGELMVKIHVCVCDRKHGDKTYSDALITQDINMS